MIDVSTVLWMAMGVGNIVAIQPTPRVIFGGGVANKQSHRLGELEGTLQAHLRIVEAPRIMLSAFYESAGTIGALALLQLD